MTINTITAGDGKQSYGFIKQKNVFAITWIDIVIYVIHSQLCSRIPRLYDCSRRISYVTIYNATSVYAANKSNAHWFQFMVYTHTSMASQCVSPSWSTVTCHKWHYLLSRWQDCFLRITVQAVPPPQMFVSMLSKKDPSACQSNEILKIIQFHEPPLVYLF